MSITKAKTLTDSTASWLPRPLWGWLWVAVVVATLLSIVLTWRNDRLQTDVMSLLPVTEDLNKASEGESRYFNDLISGQVVWVVKAPVSSVKTFYQTLEKSGDFTSLQDPLPDDQQNAWGKAVMSLRLGLLSPDMATELETKEGSERFIRQTLSQLFSPLGAPSLSELTADPFLLIRHSRLQRGGLFPVSIHEGWLSVSDPETQEKWFLIAGHLKPTVAAGSGASDWVAKTLAEEKALLASIPGAQLFHQGSVFYSAWASESAKADINLLGGISLVGLTLLLWIAYRSFTPLFLCLFSILTSAVMGIGATLLVFGSIHTLTLVMCVSLVGICADYTTYYVARRRYFGRYETPLTSLFVLRPSLLHAIVSTALAYGVMVVAPFPGLRQLAIFSVAGLCASWLTVYLTFPWLVKRIPTADTPRLVLSRWPNLWNRFPRLGMSLTVLATVVALTGLWHTSYNDDLRMLQTPSQELVAHEAGLKKLLARDFSQTGFIVRGDSAQTALQNVEALEEKLNALKAQGLVRHWVNTFPLSEKTQERVRDALAKLLPRLSTTYAESGLPTVETSTLPNVISFETWETSPLGEENSRFIYHAPNGAVSLLIPVSGVNGATSEDAFAKVAQEMPEVVWHNRRVELEKTFAATKKTLMVLLAIAWVAAAVSLIRRFGLRAGLLGAYTVALSMLASLAATTLLGLPINLFSLFALILILGISIDYVVFFLEFQNAAETTLRAMIVALTSTLVSLGILTLSHTAAVMNFGWVLSIGVLTAFIFAPLAKLANKKQN